MAAIADNPAARTALNNRLRPLRIAQLLQNIIFWAPTERLFMTQLGFDAATIGLIAAAGAALVPLLNIPSGIVADRWSRRGVLAIACVALLLGSLLGGLSTGVSTYSFSALAMAVYYALSAGAVGAMVYDTVLEETGDSAAFRKALGQVFALNSAGLVISALLGGWLASLAGPRLTYLLTVPFAALSLIVLFGFREPCLHESAQRIPVCRHIGLTVSTVVRRRRLLPLVTLALLTAVLLVTIHDFGAFWLIALTAPAWWYGPRWAGVVSALGVGGFVAGRFRLTDPMPVGGLVTVMVLCAVSLVLSHNTAVVVTAQALLAITLITVGIQVSSLLHDAVPSAVRAGVGSGIDTLAWIAYLPVALAFGLISAVTGSTRPAGSCFPSPSPAASC